MFKAILRSLASRRLVRGLLVGVGGGVLTAVGWKLGTDLYEAVKRRVQQAPAPGAEPEQGPER